MRYYLVIATAMMLAAAANTSVAGPEKFQKKGFISNDAGEKCWYQQRVIKDSNYFHGSLTSTIGEIVFDDPSCMAESDVGHDVNKMMINNIISRWYSHSDANFDTRKLYKTSMFQKKGQCMQSRTYSAIGVTLEYFIENGSIVKVWHGPSVQGCQN